jgi:hypothetical protein
MNLGCDTRIEYLQVSLRGRHRDSIILGRSNKDHGWVKLRFLVLNQCIFVWKVFAIIFFPNGWSSNLQWAISIHYKLSLSILRLVIIQGFRLALRYSPFDFRKFFAESANFEFLSRGQRILLCIFFELNDFHPVFMHHFNKFSKIHFIVHRGDFLRHGFELRLRRGQRKSRWSHEMWWSFEG